MHNSLGTSAKSAKHQWSLLDTVERWLLVRLISLDEHNSSKFDPWFLIWVLFFLVWVPTYSTWTSLIYHCIGFGFALSFVTWLNIWWSIWIPFLLTIPTIKFFRLPKTRWSPEPYSGEVGGITVAETAFNFDGAIATRVKCSFLSYT
jgi:hypothetical protein